MMIIYDDYILSDAPGFIRWVKSHQNYCTQLIRAIRYLKAFAKNADREMPAGMLFTVLATRYFKENQDRDDIMLKELLAAIRNSSELAQWQCNAPVEPFDNLLRKFNQHAQAERKKKNFLERLDSFISDAQLALDEENQLKASKLWAKHLGYRFPEGEDENIDKRISQLSGALKSLDEKKSHISSTGAIVNGTNPSKTPIEHRNWSSICTKMI